MVLHKQKFLETAKEKVIIFDGAMGTSLFAYNLTAEDYGGAQYEGCPENLNFTRPDIVQEIHRKFFEAGADVVETNTFGASKLTLAEYGLADKSYEISKRAAELARGVADSFETRYVAGSIGPGTKLVSLGNVSFDELRDGYLDQVRGLIDGGVDLLLIETCQDPLQIKAALNACFAIFQKIKIKLPIHVQVTIEQMGTLLVGTDIAAALTTLAPYPIDTLGLNCATGPKEMQEHVRYLSESSPFMISCLPNAGIPENIGGHAHYPLGPEEFSDYLLKFVENYGVNIVGGCCGTTYEHIKRLTEKIGYRKPGRNKSRLVPTAELRPVTEIIESVSSLYSSVPMVMEPKPLIVGERTNANGSKLFRELLAQSDYEKIVELAKEQVEEGAHILDLCAAYVGRDEAKDMQELTYRINTAVNIPIMVDSTETPVIEESLKRISGKAVVNSVNLEDGEERVEKIASLCNKYGAALVVLTIDEQGMAKEAHKKSAVAQRLYELLVNKHGLNPRNLIYDALTFTLGSGDEEMRKAGIETIEGIRLIKEKYPEVKTILGVSNISFGLDQRLRPALNSIFMYEAIKAGLDMAIVNNKKIIPLNKIEAKLRKLCEDLIYDRRLFINGMDGDCKYDPLMELVACVDEIKVEDQSGKNPYENLPIEEILARRIIDGNKNNMELDLNKALDKGYKALDIINRFLMNGMKVVGEKFGAGEMQLPFVLQSATTMKAAVGYLERFMEKAESATDKGSIVLATVKGDVHDIGKNLVDIILSNNGYKVYNLGIKQPIEDIIKAIDQYKPNVVGLSGLLVKSTLIMKQNLEILNERDYTVPVILGGAALTRRYVEEDCANTYKGTVFYGFDAFTDLNLMEKICTGVNLEKVKEEFYKTKPRTYKEEDQKSDDNTQEIYEKVGDVNAQDKAIEVAMNYTENSSLVRILKSSEIPDLPFYGNRVLESQIQKEHGTGGSIDLDINLDEVWQYLNTDALIIGQWRLGKGKKSQEEYNDLLEKTIYPTLKRLQASAKKDKWIQPQIVYGYYPCKIDSQNINQLNIYDESKSKVIQSFIFPRQTKGEYLCLTDYFRSGGYNTVAFQIVTIGECAAKYVQGLYQNGDFTEYLYAYGLATESTEAVAEYAHAHIRRELGWGAEDDPDFKKLIKCNYHGMRYSFGYPACPNLEDQKQLFELLKPERIGLSLSEEWQIHPEHSTSAIIVHHPDSKYYNIRG